MTQYFQAFGAALRPPARRHAALPGALAGIFRAPLVILATSCAAISG
jgi:hypothetical protein